MALSRKHYVALAEVLGKSGVSPSEPLALNLSEWLREDNPRFDEERFFQAVANCS